MMFREPVDLQNFDENDDSDEINREL
jgi:hypothetical protein